MRLTGTAVRAALDLCVSCKGCKRECPTGVDMARMKIEFLAHYKARHGHTLRDRLFARLPDYGPALSRIPCLANLRDRLPGGRRLSERLLGLSAARALPRWRSDTFWRARREVPWASRDQVLEAGAAGGKAVVLLVDTFNGTFEPENVTRGGARAACGRLSRACAREARPSLLLRADLFERRHGRARPGQSDGAPRARSRTFARAARAHRRTGALVPADVARRMAGDASRRDLPSSSPRTHGCSRSSSRAKRARDG